MADALTLEQLFAGNENGPLDEYEVARQAKVYQIADHIRPHIVPTASHQSIASRIMDAAEAMGRIDGETVSGEVSGRYTLDGHPLVISV